MPHTERRHVEGRTHREYQAQKRLADALFGLFRTLGSTLRVQQVANVGLLTLTGQLLIKRAAFFTPSGDEGYRVLALAGLRSADLSSLVLPLHVLEPVGGREPHRLIDIEDLPDHPALQRLGACGFRNLVSLHDNQSTLGIIALGDKIVPGPLTPEDRQILEAFAVVMAMAVKNSLAYQLMEKSNDELLRLNEMKREFMSHVSHEFRTPLTVLTSVAEIGGVEPEIAEMQRSALSRLGHLVDSILLFNEINSGSLELDWHRIDSHLWVEEQVRPLIAVRGIELQSTLPPCMLEIDCKRLRMALECIVDNAVKFGSEKQRIRVRLSVTRRADCLVLAESRPGDVQRGARVVDPQEADRNTVAIDPQETGRNTVAIDPQEPDSLLMIEVEDAGIGIPAADLEAVFQPFTQAQNSPTRGVRGSGLGLTMAKAIVDAHGGDILCRSVVGQGTVVTMAIPLRRG